MQRHLALIHRLVQSVATGQAVETIDSEYWDWVRSGAGGLAAELRNPELRRSWEELQRVHGELLVVAESCLTAVRAGDAGLAQRCLDQVFDNSSRLVELIVGGSLLELTDAFTERERMISERYEREFLEAAEIGRFSVSLADHRVLSADENFARLFDRKPDQILGNDIRSILDPDAYDELAMARCRVPPRAC